MKQYLDLVKHVLDTGTRKESRTGVDTISTFNYNYEVDLKQGFPLLTTKKISWKNIVVENLWLFSGDTDIGLLKKHGCNFWSPWADKNGKVPSAYGNFWRHFPVPGRSLGGSHPHFANYYSLEFNDQIKWVLEELKRNPMSRRLVVSAWAPGNAQSSALPPCHYTWALNVQNDEAGEQRLNLHLTIRSQDVPLGCPYNIAGYAFILSLISRISGIKPGKFASTIIDAHIYVDQIEAMQEQLTREPRELPLLMINPNIRTLKDVEALINEDDTKELMGNFELVGYNPHPAIKIPVAV